MKKHVAGTMTAMIAALGMSFVASAHTPGAHVHGEAQAAIVIAGSTVSVTLNSAMYNITGFERAPQTPEEQAVLAEAISTLEDGDSLFVFTPEAGCQATGASHSLPPEGGKGTGTGGHGDASGDAHNPYRDLEARFEFTCGAPERLKAVTFALMARFENMQSIDVIIFNGALQLADEVTRERNSMALEEK
jgi:hypothetical protein